MFVGVNITKVNFHPGDCILCACCLLTYLAGGVLIMPLYSGAQKRLFWGQIVANSRSILSAFFAQLWSNTTQELFLALREL